jgi:hypothetical protein
MRQIQHFSMNFGSDEPDGWDGALPHSVQKEEVIWPAGEQNVV